MSGDHRPGSRGFAGGLVGASMAGGIIGAMDARAPSGDKSPAAPHIQRLQERRAALLEASRSHGAREVRVFGSVARRDERPGSDVDLLIELDADRTLLDLVAFGREASEILGVPVDVATADMLPDGAEHARSESFVL